MVKSMTGFGQGEYTGTGWSVQVEMKSVNHRYLDFFLRIPKQYNQLEEMLRAMVQEKVARGRLEITVSVEEFGDRERNVKVNRALLRGYVQALMAIQKELEIKESITLEQILMIPDLLQLEEPEVDWANLQKCFRQAVIIALEKLEGMRLTEGKQLKQDLEQRIALVEGQIEEIAHIAPTVVEDYKSRLQERLGDLLDGTTISDERFLGEVAIFADKCSIDEELVRFNSHIQQFKKSLHSQQSIGRKLEFLLQEMNREVNTIGSKGNNVIIAGLVVDIKSELEKMREQVQNIE